MQTIKVLGTGCPKCKTTISHAEKAVAEKGVEVQIIKIEDIQEIMEYNVMSTPALLIDDEMKVKGRVPTVEEIKGWLN